MLDDTAQSLFADVDNDGDQDLVLATGTQPLLFIERRQGTLHAGSRRLPVRSIRYRACSRRSRWPTTIATASSISYLCVYSYFFGAGEDKAGTPAPYYDARNGPPGVLFRNDGHGRFVDATQDAGLDAGNDHYHFAAAWADYDGDGWPDLLVANDFGTKNLYRNLGSRDGKVTFEDVAATAGSLDHGAGMSAAFLDYDNDGRLDIYTGNMWTAPRRCVITSRRRSCRMRRPRCARSIAATRAATRSSGTSATAASRTGRSTRAPRWDDGRGRPTRSTSTATAGTISTSPTAC